MNKRTANNTNIKLKIEALEKQSELIRKELEGELEVAKEKVSDVGKIILGIGGGLIVAAIILGGLAGRRKSNDTGGKYRKSKRVYHRFRDQLTHELTNQATNFILGLAKDKLATIVDKKETLENDDSDITSK